MMDDLGLIGIGQVFVLNQMNQVRNAPLKPKRQVKRPKIILRQGQMPHIPASLSFTRQPAMENPIYDAFILAPAEVIVGAPFSFTAVIKSKLRMTDIWALAVTVRFGCSKVENKYLYLTHGLKGPDAVIRAGYTKYERRLVVSCMLYQEIILGLVIRRKSKSNVMRFNNLCRITVLEEDDPEACIIS